MNTRIASLLVVAVAATVSLTGCGAIQDRVDDAVGNAVEEGVERAIEEGGGGDVDINLDGSGAELPDGFPSDIPQPPGLIQASIGTAEGFMVNLKTSEGDAESFVAEFSGWTDAGTVDLGGTKAYAFSNDSYSVAITVSANGDDTAVSYTVSVKSS